MITAKAFAGKHYAVLGLARSGLATVEALLASGARVTAWDNNPNARENLRSSRAKSRGAGTTAEVRPSTSLGTNDVVIGNFVDADLTQFNSIVVTPGLPLNRHPIAKRAAEAGVEIIGDIELFARARPELPPHKVVGITGTNGKSTTTALIHHILKSAGVPATMGGNIGLPILAQDPLPEGGVYVLELSSYQIDLTKSLDCDVAVLLNITPDHLDRYESFDAYAASKAKLFEMQSAGHLAIFGLNDVLFKFSVDFERFGIETEYIEDILDFRERPFLSERQKDWPALQGPHNLYNLAAANARVRRSGLTGTAIEQGLRTYPGLPTAWSAFSTATVSSSSTIARRPMLKRRLQRWRLTRASAGSSADRRRGKRWAIWPSTSPMS